ncbi:MAG: hypothetical protein UX98_C0009G0012 [Parcubacteria group bacterium GW2011_GWA2_47_26]|nr:MAG: hypothetical protein UX98_C0009G0012 [Parcubacteria group bacterium GW2011_GWA2_47_26]
MHPYHYTLSLLKLLIDKSEHTLLSPERVVTLRAEYEKLVSDPGVTQEMIQQKIVAVGKEVWPYHEALEELYRRYGKSKEEQLVCEKLNPELRVKYEQFLAQGGSLADFRRGTALETYFAAEEKFEIGQAVLEAHAFVLKDIAGTCRLEKKNECDEVIEDHRQKLARIEIKLGILKDMAVKSERWQAEILDKVKTFEEAFGYFERTFHEEDVDGVIDYYQGVLTLADNELP